MRLGIIEHVSEAWLDLLGYRREEVVGRPITDFMTEDSIQRRAQVVWPILLRDGAFKDAEYRLITKGGAILDVLMSGRVEREPDGRFLSILGGWWMSPPAREPRRRCGRPRRSRWSAS
jgi:PAS domain S-box-containing protein